MSDTSTQHTPGPWTQSKLSPNSVWAQIDGQNVCIAICNPKALGVSKQIEWEANARLIAAAPKLLEVCKQVMHITFAKDDYGAFKENLSLIIAKAEGK